MALLDTMHKQLLVQKEKIKMRKYNVRTLQVETGTFTLVSPTVYNTTFGGWGHKAKLLHTTDDWSLADKISKKLRQKKSICVCNELYYPCAPRAPSVFQNLSETNPIRSA